MSDARTADDWRRDRIGSALRGAGYCVLITDTPGADRLTDLPRHRRLDFLADLELLGEAVQLVSERRDPAFRRVNLEIQGNHDAFLHAHVWPRDQWEGPEHTWRPVALHPIERWRSPAPETVLGPQHDDLRADLAAEIGRLSANRSV